MDQPTQKSGSSPMKMIIIGCGILVLCSVCCLVSFFGFLTFSLGAGMNAIKSGIVEQACKDVDPSELYENNTTDNLKDNMTEEEFSAEIEVLQDEICGEIESAGVVEVFQQGWDVSLSNSNGEEELSVVMVINEKNVNIKMTNDGSGDLKFDSISID